MVVVKPVSEPIEEIVAEIVNRCIELVGGFEGLLKYDNLTWVTSLVRSAYAVVLKHELNKTTEEIAKILGITKNTAKEILEAKEEKVRELISKGELQSIEELDTHIAGALAKIAYKQLKSEGDRKIERIVRNVFNIAINILGGYKRIGELKFLTWLPSLVRAIYAVVLKNEQNVTDEELTTKLGISDVTLKKILEADPTELEQRLSELYDFDNDDDESKHESKIHIAGAIAKRAYEAFREKQLREQ
ncbi:hypothetical protein [Fervidobacterium thailandense]|uniref:Bacterio-opsin activator n=1 Tax=Fervidobacterium thailandense TaxID=1008305 RepID=A0A1E3G0X5_9BACT|nr:hypothetical protein [Fervidobacterium thailandense]ODN29872.1 hypothetical protein A4H02_08375 [Fervidobacterium thailandense]